MLSSYQIRLILDEVELILSQNRLIENQCEINHSMIQKNLERLQVLYGYLYDEKKILKKSHLQLVTTA